MFSNCFLKFKDGNRGEYLDMFIFYYMIIDFIKNNFLNRRRKKI